LAELYGVETRILVQAVRRNQTRFPEDFMFQLTSEEHEALRSQIVTSKPAVHPMALTTASGEYSTFCRRAGSTSAAVAAGSSRLAITGKSNNRSA
jgi:hypothetical protein